MRRMAKWSSVACGLVFLGLQLVPSPVHLLTSPAVAQSADLQNAIDPAVSAVLNRSCKDCHSNQTNWPWYGHVAPISWVLARHVKQGRAKLNLSEWGSRKHTYSEMEEICDAVSDGSMPLRGYTLIHRDARLSKGDVDTVCNWADRALAQNHN